jgi:hypothetical protein
VLRLNVRAVLQFLRGRGVGVAGTGRADMVDGGNGAVLGGKDDAAEWVDADAAIMARDKGRVEAWEWIDVVGLGAKASPTEWRMMGGEKAPEEEEEADKASVETAVEVAAGVMVEVH